MSQGVSGVIVIISLPSATIALLETIVKISEGVIRTGRQQGPRVVVYGRREGAPGSRHPTGRTKG